MGRYVIEDGFEKFFCQFCIYLRGSLHFSWDQLLATTGILDAQFKKPTRIIYARNQVLSCKQRDDECIPALLQPQQLPVEGCEYTHFDVQQH